MNKHGLRYVGVGMWMMTVGLFAEPTAKSEERDSIPIYTKENATHAKKVEELEQTDQVTRHGITWTFDKKVPAGKFVNGDGYVVGPVTIVAMDPKPVYEGDVRNGSMLNPPAWVQIQAFDTRTSKPAQFKRDLLAKLPIAMKPGDTLVSAISVSKPKNDGSPSGSPVESYSVLTCLKDPVSADAFRPGYCDRDHTIYLSRNLRRELLTRLALPPAPPPEILKEYRNKTWPPRIKDIEGKYERTWWELDFGDVIPAGSYQTSYGRSVCEFGSRATLMLMLDFTPQEKEGLFINFIQYGLDLWSIVKTDGFTGWGTLGGWGSGRKWPVVFAGLMLGEEKMAFLTTTYPRLLFQEDNQTHYDHGWSGAGVVYTGHAGWITREPERRPLGWGAYEHLHPSRWVDWIGTSYRSNMTSSTWIGLALAIRLLNAEKEWGNDAFLDYCDRWMHEPDPGYSTGTYVTSQGHGWYPLAETMWKAYRENLPKIPGRECPPRPPTGWKVERTIKSPAVVIGPKREFLVQGKPFFPLMVFVEHPKRINDVLAIGANVVAEGCFEKPDHVGAYWMLNVHDEKMLKELAAKKPKLVVGTDMAIETRNDTFLDELAAKGLYGVFGADARTIGHPALLGWIHLDEADKPTSQKQIHVTAEGCAGGKRGVEHLFDGDHTISGRAYLGPLQGAKITLRQNEPVTISGIAVYQLASDATSSAAKEVAFLADGKEILKVTLENKDGRKPEGRQKFDLPQPVSFKDLTMNIISTYPALEQNSKDSTWGTMLEIEALDQGGKAIALGDKNLTLGAGHDIGYGIMKTAQANEYTPELKGMPDDLLMVQPAYRWMKKMDATRPVFLTVGQNFFQVAGQKKELATNYLKNGNVVGCKVPGAQVGEAVAKLRELAGPDKPIYAWIGTRGAKPGDIRAQVCTALAKGATAIGYRGFEGLGDEKPDATVMDELKKLNEQITRHAAALLADPEKAKVLLGGE